MAANWPVLVCRPWKIKNWIIVTRNLFLQLKRIKTILRLHSRKNHPFDSFTIFFSFLLVSPQLVFHNTFSFCKFSSISCQFNQQNIYLHSQLRPRTFIVPRKLPLIASYRYIFQNRTRNSGRIRINDGSTTRQCLKYIR